MQSPDHSYNGRLHVVVAGQLADRVMGVRRSGERFGKGVPPLIPARQWVLVSPISAHLHCVVIVTRKRDRNLVGRNPTFAYWRMARKSGYAQQVWGRPGAAIFYHRSDLLLCAAGSHYYSKPNHRLFRHFV